MPEQSLKEKQKHSINVANCFFSSPADSCRKLFTEDEIESVLNKATTIDGEDSSGYRLDYAGAWIKREEYCNTESTLGWETDHRKPVAKNGSDDISNLDPLQWNNNRTESDDYSKWKTSMKASGSLAGRHFNVEQKQGWKID